MMLTNRTLPILLGLLLVISGNMQAEPRSGYEFIKPDTRAMQDDDFENPGYLTVERGQELFNEVYEKSGKSCASCHGETGETLNKAKIASYPVYREKSGEILTLQRRINNCRKNFAGARLETDHPDLLALETFVRNRAFGEKVNVKTEGAEIQEILKKGEALYNTRYGLIDMACFHCHTMYPGTMIRGQHISQGMGNGFPAYRLDIGEITNLSQRIKQCLTLMRAEPFPADSDESKQLQYYLMSRSNGLAIETPAVRY